MKSNIYVYGANYEYYSGVGMIYQLHISIILVPLLHSTTISMATASRSTQDGITRGNWMHPSGLDHLMVSCLSLE